MVMMMSVADKIFQKDSSSWHRAYPFRICFKLHILHLAKARHSTFVTIVTRYPMGSCQQVGLNPRWGLSSGIFGISCSEALPLELLKKSAVAAAPFPQPANPQNMHHRRHRISSRCQANHPPFQTVNTPAINIVMSFTMVIVSSLELWKFGLENRNLYRQELGGGGAAAADRHRRDTLCSRIHYHKD